MQSACSRRESELDDLFVTATALLWLENNSLSE